MKLLKKSPLDITATLLMTQTTRDNNILLSCLHRINNMIRHCLWETTISKLNNWLLLSTQSYQQVPTEPECNIKRLKYPQRNAINKLEKCKTKFTSNQAQLADCSPQKQQKHTTPELAQDHDWARLTEVKATDQLTHDNIPRNGHTNKYVLAGKSILHVGGRAALYPEYRRLITSLGGCLLIYRGSLKCNMNRLYTLLENADMIICPIDCINHNDFFAVKFYCKLSGKPYTLLDHSNLATFNKGVKMLIRLNCQHTFLPNKYTQAVSF